MTTPLGKLRRTHPDAWFKTVRAALVKHCGVVTWAAKELEVKMSTLRNWVKDTRALLEGIVVPPVGGNPPGRSRRLRPEYVERMRSVCAGSLTHKDAAKQLGISVEGVRQAVKRHGLKMWGQQ